MVVVVGSSEGHNTQERFLEAGKVERIVRCYDGVEGTVCHNFRFCPLGIVQIEVQRDGVVLGVLEEGLFAFDVHPIHGEPLKIPDWDAFSKLDSGQSSLLIQILSLAADGFGALYSLV